MVKRSAKLIAAQAKAKRQGWIAEIRTEADERAVLSGCYFDQRRADHVVEFGPRYLRHTKGDFADKPFDLMDWQRDQLFRPLFGWVKDSDEYGRTIRRYRRAYVQIPKKNGKSALASYLALYMTMADGEDGAECYSAATDRNQAAIVWSAAADMAEASPKLAKAIRVNRVVRNLAFHQTRSFYRVLSGCPRRNEGWQAHLIVADELHKWYGRELFDALKWAFAARSQPLLFMISTAGDDPTGVCHEQYEYATRVLSGAVRDEQFLPLIYEAKPDEDPDDVETWLKANPSLGRNPSSPLKLSSFRADYEEAKQSPGLWESWRQLRLNIWRSSTRPWLDVSKWDAGVDSRRKRRRRIDCWEDYTADDLSGWDCWGGIDLALTTDLSAFVLVFPDDLEAATDDVVYRTLARFWLPEETARKYADRVPYLHWAREGWITLTPGSEVEFDAVLAGIQEAAERYQLNQVGYDPMFASYMMQRAETEIGIQRIEFQQSFANYTEPCQLFERAIMQGRLRHNGDPVLTWCLGNTSIRTDEGGRMRPIRPKRRDHRRIDGTVACLMGLALALRRETAPRADYYEQNEPEFV